MKFQFGNSSDPGPKRGSRNNEKIVLVALLEDPLGDNPSDAAIRRYAERVDRTLARLEPKGSAARRSAPHIVVQRNDRGRWHCKKQAKYKRGRVAAQHAASTRRSGRK